MAASQRESMGTGCRKEGEQQTGASRTPSQHGSWILCAWQMELGHINCLRYTHEWPRSSSQLPRHGAILDPSSQPALQDCGRWKKKAFFPRWKTTFSSITSQQNVRLESLRGRHEYLSSALFACSIQKIWLLLEDSSRFWSR